MRKLFFTLLIISFSQVVSAQDTLLLITGRKIIVSSVDLGDNSIAYRGIKEGSKVKNIEPDRLFSIIYRDGNERVIYQPDSLDPLDFKVDEMRYFIHGEQDARELYKNNIIKAVGVCVGAGSAWLAFYGLVGPPIYATIVGSYSPNVEKQLSFVVSGEGAEALGISTGKYLNDVTGKNSMPVIKKDQQLKIANKTFRFKADTGLDSTISLINSRFKCVRIHAANDNGKIKLFKTDSSTRLSEGPYREGFEKNVRDYKIRNSMIYGLAGFIAGIIVYSAVLNN